MSFTDKTKRRLEKDKLNRKRREKDCGAECRQTRHRRERTSEH